ncbi:hypothetical protein HY628_02735 [Candidatus Uhrbacteria bacterium]|nr:hypothetical protein [Candidatus Uhrbacteria bacterium]
MKRIKKRFPRSVAKYIREEKGRIRRMIQDPAEQSRLMAILSLFQNSISAAKPRNSAGDESKF